MICRYLDSIYGSSRYCQILFVEQAIVSTKGPSSEAKEEGALHLINAAVNPLADFDTLTCSNNMLLRSTF